MRRLANFDDKQAARLLADVLYAHDIEGDVRSERDGTWTVWIVSEEDLKRGRAILETHQDNQETPQYRALVVKGRAKRGLRAAREKKKPRSKTVDLRLAWRSTPSRGRLTMTLMLICLGVAVITELGDRHDIVRHLTIADYQVFGGVVRWQGLADVKSGELWRLVTPIFLHFGSLHLLFNLWWLFDLGSAIEERKGAGFLATLIGLIAVISNLAEFVVGANPRFGGMSGVVYGLLGYMWMLGKFQPASGLAVAKPIVAFMLAWLVLGFTGLVGPIANLAHLGGLAVGSLWGYLASGDLKRRLRK